MMKKIQLIAEIINGTNGIRSPHFKSTPSELAKTLADMCESYPELYSKYESLKEAYDALSEEEKEQTPFTELEPHYVGDDYILVLQETHGDDGEQELSKYPLMKVETFIKIHKKEEK